ncbi:peptidase inhibitor family I36 protein [Kitasatospora sp. NPDC015120]|uniref:peptidase inhibitor family I36 protein n=1 Tax=Kitasatospora sp. NPDC015120 TaxID=3364023 RepID=UPI0036F499AA
MIRRLAFALAAGTIAAALGFAPSAAAGPGDPAGGGARQSVRSYDDCPAGNFCIFSDYNGGGRRCWWPAEGSSSVPDTAAGCPFIRDGQNVRSVRNRTEHRVQYYTSTNYNNRVGSTLAGGQGNLQGTYQIRSFKPQ